MTLDEIKQLVDFIRERDLSEFELERADVKLRIKSGTVVQTVMAAPAVAVAAAPVVAAAPAAPSPAAVAPAGEDLAIITSPIVGTFYRAAEPGAKPFVDTGDMVRKGQVLFVIDPRPFAAAVQRAEAEVEAAKVRLASAERESARAEQMLKTQAISVEGADQRVTRLGESKAALAAALANLEMARLNLDYSQIRSPIDGRVRRGRRSVPPATAASDAHW